MEQTEEFEVEWEDGCLDLDERGYDAWMAEVQEACADIPPFSGLLSRMRYEAEVEHSREARSFWARREARPPQIPASVDEDALEALIDAEEAGGEPDPAQLALAERLDEADSGLWTELRRRGPSPDLALRANAALGHRHERRARVVPQFRSYRRPSCARSPRARARRAGGRRVSATRAGPDDGGGDPEPGRARPSDHTDLTQAVLRPLPERRWRP